MDCTGDVISNCAWFPGGGREESVDCTGDVISGMLDSGWFPGGGRKEGKTIVMRTQSPRTSHTHSLLGIRIRIMPRAYRMCTCDLTMRLRVI